MENHQKIEEISRQIAEIDGELASLFDQIIRNMDFENRLNHNLDANNWIKPKRSRINIENIVSPIGGFDEINVIPGELNTSCHTYCACFAFDKWQSSIGFRGIASGAIDYWLTCPKINRGTLIFTSAWDDVDFFEKYKNRFDRYTQDPQHTVAVIFISSMGINLQYFK